MKTCRRCKVRKPFGEFPWRPDRGRDSYCYVCTNKLHRSSPSVRAKNYSSQNAYSAAEKRLIEAHPRIYRRAYNEAKARLTTEGQLRPQYIGPYAQNAAKKVMRQRFPEEFTSYYAEERALRGLSAPRALQYV